MTRISRYLNPFLTIKALVSRINDSQQAWVESRVYSMIRENRDRMKMLNRLNNLKG
jgi:hypothetical protein